MVILIDSMPLAVLSAFEASAALHGLTRQPLRPVLDVSAAQIGDLKHCNNA